MTIDMKFLVVPCKSVYNRILERPFAAILDVVASHVYFKIKYHNVHNEPMNICVDLSIAWRIH